MCKFRSKISDVTLNDIYDYWLQKNKYRTLNLECERIASYTLDTPYSAFRKRNDRIITRRYRKHDEQNYEKMYQFKKTFEQFANIAKNISTREEIKYQLIYNLKSIFHIRNNIQDWNGDVVKEFSFDSSFDVLHTNAYFNGTLSSFNANRIMDLKRTKQIREEDFESHFKKSCEDKALLSYTDANYTESTIIIPSTQKSYSINPDGRFSFVSNDISKYIPPQYSGICEQIKHNRIIKNDSNFGRSTVKLNLAKSETCVDSVSKHFSYPPYHKERLKSTILAYRHMYPKICSSPKQSIQSFFCLY